MNVYDIYVNECRIPLTVIAESYEDAERIYDDWRMAHDLGAGYKLRNVTQHDGAWLADHPQLAELAAKGTVGVTYWLGHRHGWRVAAPDVEPIGELQPPTPPIECFFLESDAGKHFMVFATSPEHALTLYLAMRERVYRDRPHRFTIRAMSRWLLTGDKCVLREEMDAGLMGIAARSDEDGWHIFPPDDDRVDP